MKFDNNGKQRTDAYVGTFATDDAAGMLEVESIKSFVKNMNKELSYYKAKDSVGRDIRFRTTIKARKPINKITNPRTGNKIGYSTFGDVIGGMENAGAVDVYIHRYMTDAMWRQKYTS